MWSFEAFTVLNLAQMWREGSMPNAGGVLDQPDRLRILVQFVRSQEEEDQAAAIKKLRK